MLISWRPTAGSPGQEILYCRGCAILQSFAYKSLTQRLQVVHRGAERGCILLSLGLMAYTALGTSSFAAALAMAFPPALRSFTLMVTWDTPFKILYGLCKGTTKLRWAHRAQCSLALIGWRISRYASSCVHLSPVKTPKPRHLKAAQQGARPAETYRPLYPCVKRFNLGASSA